MKIYNVTFFGKDGYVISYVVAATSFEKALFRFRTIYEPDAEILSITYCCPKHK